MQAQEYAQQIVRLLQRGGPTVPPVASDLLQKAITLDAALAGPAGPQLEQAKQDYRAAFAAAAGDIRAAIADAAPIPEIARELQELELSGSLDLEATLGPLYIAVRSPSVSLRDPTDESLIVLGPLPPDAFSAKLDATPIKGGGTLLLLPDGLSGVISADLGFAQAAVLASLRKAGSQPSFLAILSAGFQPGIQLGFGFQISRIGGAVGINRTLDPDALARRIGDGSAAKVLFPLDIGRDGRQALEAAEQLFPPAVGSAVAGPTFRLSWLEIGGAGFLSADIGVLVELPGPRRIVIVGLVHAGVDPIIRLNAAVAGVLDFAQERATLDAALTDSGALGIFTVYGDLAFASCWGPQSYTVLSMGGFYPGFRPEPAHLRPLKRLGLSLDNPLPGLRLRAEGYVAATTNTIQIGGRLDVGYDAGIASLTGFVGVDALVQFDPFHIHADLAAGIEVRFLGQTFCGVSLHGTIDAPGPVTLAGNLKVETFLKDFDLHETWVFGSPHPIIAGAARRAIDVAAAQLIPRNLRAIDGHDPFVRLNPSYPDGDRAVVSARNGVEWRQHAIPLDTPIDRVAGTPLGSTQTVNAETGGIVLTGTAVKDKFAPGSFITLSAAEALNGPTYDDLPAGLVASGDTITGTPIDADNDVQVLVKVGADGPLLDSSKKKPFMFTTALLAMVAERRLDAAVATKAAIVTITPSTWSTAGQPYESATQAMQAAREQQTAALPAAELLHPVVLAGL